ncbi:single-stranded DNA-binding protein [Nocardiopsis coralli]|uniref:single-stranded DNA-binding protein n=1 Tax=Nocardiopsis coralli TaxID=2772213 RepID=UPI002E28F5E7|nr:single-stranded DNA-binding protein [Nocardiopsis coralli]
MAEGGSGHGNGFVAAGPEGGARRAEAPGGSPTVAADRDGEHHNEVGVVGRVTAEPRFRELPSGDHLATWRICVTRDPSTRFRGRASDSITCVSFDQGVHEHLRDWRLGDVVDVRGALRRRTWRGVNGRRSVCEVEAASVRFVRARRKGER